MDDHLPDGIKFHDGTPLTATVVKNNLDAYRGKYPGRNPFLFRLVLGPFIKDVTADDAAKTVTVTTAQPWPAFAAYLWSEHRLGIMAQKQLDDGADCAKDLIGTGPFMLKEWVVNDHFTAVKNPNYWKKDKDGVQLPYLDQITFKPVPDGQQRLNGLQSGQFQVINTATALDVEQIRALAKQGTITNNESDKFTTNRPADAQRDEAAVRQHPRPQGGRVGVRLRHVPSGPVARRPAAGQRAVRTGIAGLPDRHGLSQV